MLGNSSKFRQLPLPIMHDVLDVIDISNYNLDQNVLGRHILETLSKIVFSESSALLLADENNEFTTLLTKNLCERKTADFLDYFYRLDPLQLLHGTSVKRNIFQLYEVIDYRSFLSSEYYNDFYKPQKINHKLIINLRGRDRLYGEVCMHRSSLNNNFSGNEIHILKTVIPYFVHALEHNELRQKIQHKDSLLNIIDEDFPTGIIILDKSMKVIYVNKKAIEFCKKVFEYPVVPHKSSPLPPVLIEDCFKIKNEISQKKDQVVFPKTRVFQNRRSEKYHMTSRLIKKEFHEGNRDLFMISVDRISGSKNIAPDILKETYQLTNREAEIAACIFKGLKNAEIAQKLFVAEITVKWHIHNIFEKVGVNTRTAFIHKVLFQESSHPPQIESIVL